MYSGERDLQGMEFDIVTVHNDRTLVMEMSDYSIESVRIKLGSGFFDLANCPFEPYDSATIWQLISQMTPLPKNL